MGTLLQTITMAWHTKLEIVAITCVAGDRTFENVGDFTALLRSVHQEPEIQATKADATGEKSAITDVETITKGSTTADVEATAEESSAAEAQAKHKRRMSESSNVSV